MNNRFIHLLYVPTMACNMQCKYCYLEEGTVDREEWTDRLKTLAYAVEKFKEAGVIPFNISLHGGEVTTLSKEEFHKLIAYIHDYYEENREVITHAGFTIGRPHIKTNLYGLDRHIDTIREYQVSVSGSLDLPLSLHDKYRVSKGGEGTLSKILENISLLTDIPCKKKVSATLFREHLEALDEIVEDIRFLDKNTCLDMNDFNFMIGFASHSNKLLHPMSEEEQVLFYQRMHEEFDGTGLDAGVNGAWFDEFGPGYCSNCDNCGEKFFLLEYNGDVYSCVRGQKSPDYYYGNIYKDSVQDILSCAAKKIFMNHNRQPLSEECTNCDYLYLCKTGCPFVKNVYHASKSYTCLLQKQMYRDREYAPDICREETLYQYVSKMRLEDSTPYIPKPVTDSYPSLEQMILKDSGLKYIYDDSIFTLEADGIFYPLASQILKPARDIIYLTKKSVVKLHMKKFVIEEQSDYPENNALYIMLLSGNLVTYGDEERTKQRHIATLSVYKGTLDRQPQNSEDTYVYDISSFLKEYQADYSKENPNNIFFTTQSIRDYHYQKQKNNAYYHIQAINLPFQNIEFFYLDKEVSYEF